MSSNEKRTGGEPRNDLPILAPPPAEAPAGEPAGFSRRSFLELAGFSMSAAALAGCNRAPEVTALPFVDQPEGLVPGRSLSYASTCAGCSAGCGVLVGVRDGRPLKMEGSPEHPLSAGGLCAVGQAAPLGLYDSQRLTAPLIRGEKAEWKEIDKAVVAALAEYKSEGAVALLTSTVNSPTLQAEIDAFLADFADGRHVMLDPVSSSAILDAHLETHGVRVLPRYQFDQAKLIVSFGADFLGSWISPVEHSAAWSRHRTPTADDPHMSRHIQLEGRMSLSGSNADRRYRLAPDEYSAVLSSLAANIGQQAKLPAPQGQASSAHPLSAEELKQLAEELWAAKGNSLVISDSQDLVVQKLVNYLNHALGNYGKTLDIYQASRQRLGNDRQVEKLVADLKAGEIKALLVADVDLLHALPQRDQLAKAIGAASLTISFAERINEFAEAAQYVCPDHHALESWLDASPIVGLAAVRQPTLRPLGNTRSLLESLNRWRGQNKSAYELVQAYWKQKVAQHAEISAPFQAFWDQAVHDGFVALKPDPSEQRDFQFDRVSHPAGAPGDDLQVSLYAKISLPDARHAHNPWLQELPDPLTKVTWDNYICVSPHLAEQHDLKDGDLVAIKAGETSLELPAYIQMGQHDRVLAVALGYGVLGTDRFAKVGPQWLEANPTVKQGERVGKNAAPLLRFEEGQLQHSYGGVSLEKRKGRRALATTQDHFSLEVPARVAPRGAEKRDIVQETTLSAFAKDSHAGAPHHHEFGDKQLWAEDHPKVQHHWGMSIDLNRCTGCSACLIACQSENNVPVVGKDEVQRQREMHWLRIDRYYSGDEDDLGVAHQPMMCQHCDNAPCETVCPVLATVHGDEGLNEQAYNRCVGTRYCANNCPYKVRRFNWFKYEHNDEMQNLALNPDVTVRGRGVMEKCSMCVQRIEEGKIEASRLGLPVADGDIQTACQQTCPAQAIEFGDLIDKQSKVHAALENPRRYGVLEEFNFRPTVSYLRVVKNREEEGGEHHQAEDEHHA